MYGSLKPELAETLAGLRDQGTYKSELVMMTTPQGAHVEDDTISFSSCFDANGGLFGALLGDTRMS